jgi:hypothetical protein
MPVVTFPEGTQFGKIECVDSVMLADVFVDGKRTDVVVIGPCPHCSPSASEKPYIYIWDDAVFVVANSLSEARAIAVHRVKHMPTLVSLVQDEEPHIFGPTIHVAFHASQKHQGVIK